MSMMMPESQQQIQSDDPMLKQQAPTTILQSTYPPAPMEYVNLFTNENVKLGKVPPPPPIIKDSYMSFGKPIDPNDVLIRSLETQGIQCLYNLKSDEKNTLTDTVTKKINTNNHKRELKKLNHSILIAYLDLLEILVKAPNTLVEEVQPSSKSNNDQSGVAATTTDNEQPQQLPNTMTLRDQKLQDIELLFINMHHLINELRPHQARDNIRCILEMQKQQRIETAKKFKTHIFKIVDLLKICINSIQSDPNGKASVYFDELNGLLKNANKLVKSLDKLNNGSLLMESDLIENSNDIEMKPVEENNNNNINNNNNNTVKKIEKQLLETISTTSNNINNLNKNCDFKDLVLCDLIDDYLTKENEF
jgi:mediator of RNA polymerase II transcription subunit 7